ncbi:MAG: CPBP family intramembrane metalloprotease [Bacteroidota bacterium]|nr:CPBP family intramembrane metalloprotease [Bacteroidota bacterium]
MNQQTAISKALHFFITKIIIGIAVLGGLVFLVELAGRLLLNKTQLPENTKNLIIAVIESAVTVCGYIFLFRVLEKRQVKELSASSFIVNAIIGCITGLLLQTLFIIIIYISGTYSVTHVNPISTLIIPFTFALQAGFVAEILIYGVLFRLIEEQSGTVIALAIFIILFAVLHINIRGATFVSVGATAMQAGFMLPAAYIFSRSLWLPIFLHFSWDFAEPGIFGGINPGAAPMQGLLSNKIAGSLLLTGGKTGPQDSLQSLILCLLVGILFLLLAKRKNNILKPNWKITATNK